jgi:ribosomal protein S27E
MEAVWDQPADRSASGAQFSRHRPEETLLYKVIEQHYPDFLAQIETDGRTLPQFVRREFEEYLKCGRLEHGFLRVRCTDCHAEKLVAFSCKPRGFCRSCRARRMVESAALLIDEALPARRFCLWVSSERWSKPSCFVMVSTDYDMILSIDKNTSEYVDERTI